MVLGQDAYHYPNRVLEVQGERSNKGRPHTFDCAKLCRDLEALHQPGSRLRLPVYDRWVPLTFIPTFCCCIKYNLQLLVLDLDLSPTQSNPSYPNPT